MDPTPQPVTKSTEAEKKRRLPSRRGDASWKAYSDQWQNNHGTLLMIFAAAILLSGIAILAFQQNRFRKPSFPPSRMLQKADDDPRSGSETSEISAGISPDEPAFELNILGMVPAGEVDGGGQIRIAIYASSEYFNQPEFAIAKRTFPVTSEGQLTCKISLETLPSTFAIAAFQDANENGILDRNVLGIPSERYGFSNAARGKVGPPSFGEAVVKCPVPDGQLEINIW